MNVLIISQCTGRARTETRRILDQFAERRGDGTWQTPITQIGLDTIRKSLRKTARKNTAVACHWLKKNGQTELVWIVGNASRFNANGAIPTNTTQRDILRSHDENTWHSIPVIHILVGIASLFHDLGKANTEFQSRLKKKPETVNRFRHEWVSLCLFYAFIRSHKKTNDSEWLTSLTKFHTESLTWPDLLTGEIQSFESFPFEDLSPFAQAIGWLMVSHHRLPTKFEKHFTVEHANLTNMPNSITPKWNERCPDDPTNIKKNKTYWTFPSAFPPLWGKWRDRVQKLAHKALNLSQEQRDTCLADPYIMHLSRMCLMLADRGFSSLPSEVRTKPKPLLYANTTTNSAGKKVLDQTLEEHLLGVEKFSRSAVRMLPQISKELPRLARHKEFRKRNTIKKYQWQDKAGDLAASVRTRSMSQGAFIINMASTGCGKTLANGRIMYNLAEESQGMRCAFALGLRTLTLQTGQEFRQLLHLGEDEVALRVGGAATKALFEFHEKQKEELQSEIEGRESSEPLMSDDSYVFYEGNLDALKAMNHLLDDQHARALLLAPMLVCTIDHLIPATESLRGGRQLAPMLRLLSGDLVLDELDDYAIEDLHAITRLVYWAGLLGSRVLLSSATLPPSLCQGMFLSYQKGREWFQRNRGEVTTRALPVCCLWVDEFHCTAHDCHNGSEFEYNHVDFADKRRVKLKKEPVRRRGSIVPIQTDDNDYIESYAKAIMESAATLHQTNATTDPQTGKRVSFGLVRMANINPLYDVALRLFQHGAPAGIHVHLCVYHSQFPLFLRSNIEQRLENILKRKEPLAVFEIPEIRQKIDEHGEQDHLFIVLSSPVSEVGRDFDLDWAVVEPSSMRSLIQLAGRIRRHRDGEWPHTNVIIFNKNIKELKNPDGVGFCRPGFETKSVKMTDHDVSTLLHQSEYEIIDAQPRILARDTLDPQKSLVDLEHFRLQKLMLKERDTSIGAYSCWDIPQSMLSGMLQKKYPFRKQREQEIDLWLKPNEDGTDYILHEFFSQGKNSCIDVPQETRNQRIEDACSGEGITAWGEINYMDALRTLAHNHNMELEDCARKFSIVTLPDATYGWRFHPFLGFSLYDPE